LLNGSAEEALAGAEVAMVSTSDPAALRALCTSPVKLLFDMNGRLGADIEAFAAYEGVSW
jgi:hypothetical protein